MKFSFNTIVAPTYKGRDYNYYIQPLKEYGAAYKEVEKEYADLIAQTEAWKVKANQEENPIAYDMYNRYSAMLSEASANFSRGMTQTNRRVLLGLKKNYAQEIMPIAEAAKALDAANAEMTKNGPDAIYHKSSPLKIDDFLHGAKPNTKYSSAKGITAKVTAGMTSLKAAYKGDPTLTKGTRGKDLEKSGFSGLTPEDRQLLDNITPDNYDNNPWLDVQSTNDKNLPNINLRRAAAKFKVDTLKAEGWDDMDDEAKKKALNAANQGLLAVMETPDSKYVASSATTEWLNSINTTKAAHNYELYTKSEYYGKVPYEAWEKMFTDSDSSSSSKTTKVSKGTQETLLANFDKLKSGDHSTTMVSLNGKGPHGGELVVDNSTPSAPKRYEIYTDAAGVRQVVAISGKMQKSEDSVVDDVTNMRNAVKKDITFEIINGEAKKTDVKAGVPLAKGNGVAIVIRGYQGVKPFITKQDVVDAFERSYKNANDDLPEDFNQPGSDSERKINAAYLNITKAITNAYYGENKEERPNINNSIQIGWDEKQETISSFRITGASNNPVAQKQNPINAVQIDQTKSASIQSGIDQLQSFIDSPYESDEIKEQAIAKRDELQAILSDVKAAENKKAKEEEDKKKAEEQQAKKEAEIKAQKEEHNKKVALANFVKNLSPKKIKAGAPAVEHGEYEYTKDFTLRTVLDKDSMGFTLNNETLGDWHYHAKDTSRVADMNNFYLKYNDVETYQKRGAIKDIRPTQSVIKTRQGKVILQNLDLGKDPEKAQANVRVILQSKQVAEAQAHALSQKYQNSQGQELLKAVKSQIETAESKVSVSEVQQLYENAINAMKTLESQLEAEKQAKMQKAKDVRPVQGVQVQTQGSVRMNTTQQEIDAIAKQAMSN